VNQERYENKLTQIKIDARVIQQTALRQKGTDVMFGRNPRQSENSKSIILGGHSLGGTLVLAEEADSLTEKLIKDALRNITGEKDRIVAITNPNDPDSYIGRMAKWYEDYLDDKEYTPNEWHITQIGWDDMPTNPKSPDYNPSIPSVQFSNLLQPKTVNSFITSYGTDSAEYNIFVLGRFDYAYKKTFITQKDIGVAITTTADTESEFIGRPILGVDLALFGENKTVAYIRYDILTEYVDHISVFEHTCTEECVKKSKYIARIRYIGEIDDRVSDQTTQAKWVIDLAKNHNVAQIRFDGSGLGAPFQKTLEDEITRQGLDVYGVSLVASRHDLSPSVYFNDRAAWWGQVKQGFIQGDIDIDEQDERLIKELKSLGYNRDSSNRIVLQAKKELSVSPDYADSFVLAALPNESIEAMLAPKKQTQIVELPEYNLPDFGEFLTNPLAGCLNLDPFGDETQDRLAGVFGSNALYL
jgi:hypothetical protein